MADALKSGHITPAAQTWAMELCMADPASFDTFLDTSPARFAHITDPTRTAHLAGTPPGRSGHTRTQSQEVAILCDQLGLKPERFDSQD